MKTCHIRCDYPKLEFSIIIHHSMAQTSPSSQIVKNAYKQRIVGIGRQKHKWNSFCFCFLLRLALKVKPCKFDWNKTQGQDGLTGCTLMTASCSNFRFEIQMNETCREAEYASINATRLAANGQSDEGYFESKFEWLPSHLECRFTQNDDSNWAMNVSMTNCSILAQHVNETDISYHLELSAYANTSNGIL